MFSKLLLALPLIFATLCVAAPGYITFPSDVPWVTQESDHFQIIFRDGQKDFSLRALKAAERAYKLLTPIFPEAPPKTWIVLADFQDSTNGYALNFSYPHIALFAAPPESVGQLASLDQWLDSVVLHEYVHILHLYPAHGFWSLMHAVFGTVVVHNGMMPSHFHEGTATFLETEFSKGGRGRSSHFGMYRRKSVESGAWGETFAPIDVMDGAIRQFPHGVSAYFWGETLQRELWTRKGKQGFQDLALSYSSNWPYFQNIPLKQVYGTTYDVIWADIFEKTKRETKTELEKIGKGPLSKLTYLTTSGYRKLDPVFSPNGAEVAFRLDSPYRDEGGIQVLDSHSGKVIFDSTTHLGLTEGLCWGEVGGKEPILFLKETSSDGYKINSIYAHDRVAARKKPTGELDLMDLRSGTKDFTFDHIHRFGCSKDLKTLYVYKEVGGEGALVQVETQLEKWSDTVTVSRQWKIPTGFWVTSILGTSPAVFTLRKGIETSFYRWPPTKEPELLFTLNAYAFQLQPGKDANELYAIVSQDQRDEVWRFDLSRKTMSKVIAVSGGVNGFNRAGERLIVSSYEHRTNNAGYDIAIATPVSMPAVPIPTTQIPVDEASSINVSEVRSYSPLSTLFPRAWLPSTLFVPDGVQFGALIPWFDLSQRHVYSLYGGYDTRGEPFGDLSYNYRFARIYTLDMGAYYSPSYIRTQRAFLKRWGGSVGLSGTVPHFPPTVHLSTIFRRQEDSVLSAQTQSVGFALGLSYSAGFARRPLAISPVNGMKFSIDHAQFFKVLGASHNYFTDVGGIDGYVEAPWWRDSVLVARTKLGYTEGSPFYNSYFEGGGEVLFSQGRGTFLNRGFTNGAFLGRRMFNANLEYRFPLAWIERGVGLWPARLNVLHAALVADVTSFDYGASAYSVSDTKLPEDLMKVFYYSAGVELKSDWKFFFYLPTLLRVGLYHGFGGPYSQDLQVVFGAEATI